jgi:glycosyltransferase involved in cell wall biosynthesis
MIRAMREEISACIISYNEAANIRRCLESVKWVDEIVVVDSFSTDNTVSICREYTKRIYQHAWLGYIGQKNLIKDLSTKPWILFIDADEAVSDRLRDDILAEFSSGNSRGVDGYEFPRMVNYLGRWIRHGDWYPDIKLRLFRAAKGRCAGREPHDKVEVDGHIRRLRGHLEHHTYAGISDHIATINKFSSITAGGWAEQGKPFRMIDLLTRFIFRFIKCYIIKGGILDGRRGLIIAVSASFGVFIKYAKLWEQTWKRSQRTR